MKFINNSKMKFKTILKSILLFDKKYFAIKYYISEKAISIDSFLWLKKIKIHYKLENESPYKIDLKSITVKEKPKQ